MSHTRAKNCVTIKCYILGETTAALKVKQVQEDKDVIEWLPFSQVEEIHRNKDHITEDKVVCSKWIAEVKGLEF